MEKNSKIYIAGHRGMVGAALIRKLSQEGFSHLILRSHNELDLTQQQCVHDFFELEKPKYVFLAAAKVGGILANSQFPADFIYQNMMIEANVIHAAYQTGVKRLLFLGSSCIYPRLAPQPITEESLLSSELEKTNEPYAIAKIAGLKLCESYQRQYGCDFFSVMPTNLYGPGDNFDLETSHVVPALIRKFHEAKNKNSEVTLWGTGKPRRELLHVDDLASACLLLMQQEKIIHPLINVGYGTDITIRELAQLIQEMTGFSKTVHWDSSKPDGTPQKLLNSQKIKSLGWTPQITLREGLQKTYQEWLSS